MRQLCRRNTSLLENKAYAYLNEIKWTEIAEDLKRCCPTWWAILAAVVGEGNKSPNDHESIMCFSSAILIFHRSQRMSRIQHVLGLILDNSGITDEVFD